MGGGRWEVGGAWWEARGGRGIGGGEAREGTVQLRRLDQNTLYSVIILSTKVKGGSVGLETRCLGHRHVIRKILTWLGRSKSWPARFPASVPASVL